MSPRNETIPPRFPEEIRVWELEIYNTRVVERLFYFMTLDVADWKRHFPIVKRYYNRYWSSE